MFGIPVAALPKSEFSPEEAELFRPKEKICVFPVTSPKKLG